MARLKLSDPSQPIYVRTVLGIYEFLSSLKLAVVLILLLACLLGVATFVEANYGTAAVAFLIYQTWFFAALLALLAVNIFCAASIRFPWKRHQTGFVITHVGLLTLLAGSAISDRGSVNSQMLVFLGQSNHVAIDMDQSTINVSDIPGRPEPLQVRFHPGPFNWSDLAPYPIVRRIKSWFGFGAPNQTWVHPPQVLFDDGRTKIEVVDFYSRSIVRAAPYLALDFYQPMLKVQIPIELEMDERHQDLPVAKAPLMGVGDVMMWKSNEDDALAAFTLCKPDRTVEGDGLVAFCWKGEAYCATVKELQKLKGQGKLFPLNDRLSVELGGYVDSPDLSALVHGKGLVAESPGSEGHGVGPTVEILVHEKIGTQDTKYRIVRFAQLPYLPEGKHPAGFHAEFYHPQIRGQVDILIGPENKLAYRAWQQKLGRVVASGDLEIGKTVDTFSMGGGENVMRMTPTRFVPSAAGTSDSITPTEVVLKQPFDKGDRGESKCVNLSVTWTDRETGRTSHDTFWLKQNLPEPWESARRRQVHETNVGGDRPIKCSYHVKQTEVGFALKLVNFDLEVDPGTKTAANYTSRVIQVDVRNDPEVVRLREKVDAARDAAHKQAIRDELDQTIRKRTDDYLALLQGKTEAEQDKLAESKDALADFVITMNRPLDYPDPAGRQLRFFQENYLAPDKAHGTELGSVFRVNYDPGRPVKYLGSGLIVFGIFLMFYMRAYFFKRPAKGAVT
jgi:hypothetical protein